MGALPPEIQWVWAFSVLAQIINLILLFSKQNFRKVPFLTSYLALNLCQMGFLLILYIVPGFTPQTAGTLAWYSEILTLLAQALATTEILGITLRPYQGIWGLGWRALALASAFVIMLVALAALNNWAYAGWFQINRGYHITFACAVIACLLLIRYYSIPIPTAYKLILGGFCFYSCTEILINTVLQALSYKVFAQYQTHWQFATILSYVILQGMWLVALRKPLPVEEPRARLALGLAYKNLSPEINEHLRLLDERLMRLWKMEARSR
jgi:hypothetical protein